MTLPTPASTPLPSLPHPFCPPDSPPPELARLRHTWLQRNAPILLQPTVDITKANNPFLCLFYHFNTTNTTCVLSLVYEGESSYEVHTPTTVNRFGSLCYRSYNYRTYHRTADIDHLAYHQCNIQQQQQSPGSVVADWEVLHTTDFSGVQSWSKGSKSQFGYYYSLMHHYDLELRRECWRQWDDQWTTQQQHDQLEQWRSIDIHNTTQNTPLEHRLNQKLQQQQQQQQQHNNTTSSQPQSNTTHYRPVLYLNTSNHTMSPFNTNPITFPTSAYTIHSRYSMYPGDRAVAERFAQLAVAHKWTVYSLLPKWCCRVQRGGMEQEKREWQRLHHSVLLEGAVETERRVQAESVGEAERKEKITVGDGNGQLLAVVESMDIDASIEQDDG